MTSELFVDGGVIGKNPSKIGGTWAWCLIEDGNLIEFKCGCVYAGFVDCGVITNNFTELYAAVRALRSVPDGWEGTLYTDSVVTKHRLTNSDAFVGIPKWLITETKTLRIIKKPKIVLVGGHPTKAELIAGKRRDGRPCSPWNVFCDKACCKMAKKALQGNSRRCYT